MKYGKGGLLGAADPWAIHFYAHVFHVGANYPYFNTAVKTTAFSLRK
jgi:hypothetical protein